MKMNKILTTLVVISAAYSVGGYAHDPKEHSKEKEAPNCEIMQDIEQGKLDKNDPVTIAMMKKCHKMDDGKESGQEMEGMEREDSHHDQH
ncbi:hypothetical protein [Paraglaciecola polaris]|uniref:hypothetical protein n=1 Tax=Paraglaciecola polaris TaxID=222814 RepID=UPI0030EE13DC|tara:strand:- start:3364 stop:3633 length:270 start_codon:yes stop_codon:yes gene_type:complete